MATFLNTAAIAAVYDRIGALQDTQAFYEDPALAILIEHGKLHEAESLYEAGCGTGRVARQLLRDTLQPNCRYVGADVSARMAALARARVAAWPNAQIVRDDVTAYRPRERFSRVLSLFVVDLMADSTIAAFLRRAHEALNDDGLLCIAGLAEGRRGASALISGIWKCVHDVMPAAVGGCRPGSIARHLDPADWQIRYRAETCAYGICAEAVVAAKAL